MSNFQTVDVGDLEKIADSLQRIRVTWPTGLAALAVLLVGIVASRLVNRYLRRLAEQTDPSSATTLRLTARLAIFGIMIFAIGAALGLLGFDVLPLLSMLAIIAVAAAITLRPLAENFAAGVTLQTRRPFAAGDEVSLVGTEGTVREITARTVYIETFSGEHVYIPNRKVLDHTITNYTAGDARLSILEAGLSYDTDLKQAQTVIVSAVRSTQGVHAEPDPSMRVNDFGESTIDADIRFWHGPAVSTARAVRHDVAVNVKHALDEAGITLAYPQRVLRWAEGDANPGEPTTDHS